MSYQLCMRDEYGQSNILMKDDDLDKVVQRCKQEIQSTNVDNALTVVDKKQNWEAFMVEIEFEGQEKKDDVFFVYAGKDGRGVDQAFDDRGNILKLSEIPEELTLKMYCGTIDGEDWYASVPSRTVRGEEDLVDSLTHQALQGKDVYFIRPV